MPSLYKGFDVIERPGLGSAIVIKAVMSSDDFRQLLHGRKDALDANALIAIKSYNVTIYAMESEKGGAVEVLSINGLRGHSLVHEIGKEINLEFEIPATSTLINAINEVRSKGKILGISIVYSLDILALIPIPYSQPQIVARSALKDDVEKTLSDGSRSWLMPFYTEEVDRMLKQVRYAEFVRFEVPLRLVPEPAIEILQRTAKELKVAEEALYKGDYIDALHTLRNIMLNHLTVEVVRGNQKERRLREELKDYMLRAVPENYRSLYEEAIKEVENVLRATLRHVHKFVHEETGKLISAPLKEDVEYLYTTLLAVVRYLAQLIARWAKQSSEAKS
jgi:hypothetical protein